MKRKHAACTPRPLCLDSIPFTRSWLPIGHPIYVHTNSLPLPCQCTATGELQFAFLAFLLGQSLTGLLQWRALLTLLFRCVAAPLQAKWQPLYGKALEVVTAQLEPPPLNESVRGYMECSLTKMSLSDIGESRGSVNLFLVYASTCAAASGPRPGRGLFSGRALARELHSASGTASKNGDQFLSLCV